MPPVNGEQLLSALVAIDSVNPDLVAGGAGEAEIAALVADWLRDAGLDVEVVEAAPGRPSVVGTVRGRGGGASLMLNAHLDTVGFDGMDRPLQPRVEDGRLHGRGAYDMKGGLAACLIAAAELARGEPLAGDVVVTAVADEEHASIGMQAVLAHVRTDAAIVTEPTALRVCVAHKGFAWADVETAGRAAHGSRPGEGIDAITRMAPVLSRLAALQRDLGERPPHALVGAPSVHASLIEGGQERSSYPARCRLALERRTIPGETAADLRAELDALVRAVDGAIATPGLTRAPFAVDPGAAVVAATSRAAHRITGAAPELYGETYWMDAALIQAAGIPTVVLGPAGEGAHAAEEWVDLASVDTCAAVLAAAAHELCA
ncbi:M20/M25/M40 family metallo-hydrolase [Capillimicrobium parvum]|uniref:Acetylornithine deacetylase n=1 Tax=Capillimicrobium parvum TaxID=2884022 RepID=A0A9E6XVZ2_9ACTN|nr:M20/M25/M40 family metallo-hydrolase [Capillimicrobium parvum]UGS35404.1 Acetylornithine deacetylase [Capillimicrobium parvum]